MDSTIINIISSISVISGLGLLFGFGLGFAGKKFAVDEDDRVMRIKEALPGVNCGCCGYSGCESLAFAISQGEARSNACPVGRTASAEKIAEILGEEMMNVTPVAAYVKCAGDSTKANYRYDYFGLGDCKAAALLSGGGAKSCKYGCLGMGSCVRACKYDAISVVDGVAVVDKNKCVACGMCVKECPRKIIEFTPTESYFRVACNSKDNGKTVRENCSVGCIGCKLCEKACTYGAIVMDGFLSKIDYTKCTMCGKCAEKCPTGAIKKRVVNY